MEGVDHGVSATSLEHCTPLIPCDIVRIKRGEEPMSCLLVMGSEKDRMRTLSRERNRGGTTT
jgi:hypothetical protein